MHASKHLIARVLRPFGTDGGLDVLDLFRRRHDGRQPTSVSKGLIEQFLNLGIAVDLHARFSRAVGVDSKHPLSGQGQHSKSHAIAARELGPCSRAPGQRKSDRRVAGIFQVRSDLPALPIWRGTGDSVAFG